MGCVESVHCLSVHKSLSGFVSTCKQEVEIWGETFGSVHQARWRTRVPVALETTLLPAALMENWWASGGTLVWACKSFRRNEGWLWRCFPVLHQASLIPTQALHELKKLYAASELVVSVWQECLKAVSCPCLNHAYSSPPCSIHEFSKVTVPPIRIMWVENKGRRNRGISLAMHGKPSDAGRCSVLINFSILNFPNPLFLLIPMRYLKIMPWVF